MSKYIPGNQKHLTLDDRIYIENELSKGTSFKDIARFLCKDPTTVSKEIRAHRLSDWYHKGTFYNAKNFCVHRYHCKKTNACGKIVLCGIKCTSCPTCNQTCPDFEKEQCPRLTKAPYVCNGCPMKINHCTIAHKYTYNARFADRKYREKLSGSRAGISLTKHELRQKDKVISPLIEQGQSPYQIVTNHPELDMSVRTVYSYLDMGLFTARNIDLKRKVKFKPRRCHKTQITDRSVFTGRTYTDFSALGLSRFTEMDTVHSSRESRKTLLTFFFTEEKLFLAFLMNRCTKGAVRLVFDRLEKRMGAYGFASAFEYILTDRGSEFGDPVSLETGVDGIQRTSLYYCDPMRSGQKGGLEESLGGRTPYNVALETLGKEALKCGRWNLVQHTESQWPACHALKQDFLSNWLDYNIDRAFFSQNNADFSAKFKKVWNLTPHWNLKFQVSTQSSTNLKRVWNLTELE